MQVQITDMSRSKYNSLYFSATCGKKSALVFIDENGGVDVIVENASHKAWGGMGKRFQNKQAAVENYKSSEIKEIIQTAFEQLLT
jgi:hypothetical protein